MTRSNKTFQVYASIALVFIFTAGIIYISPYHCIYLTPVAIATVVQVSLRFYRVPLTGSSGGPQTFSVNFHLMDVSLDSSTCLEVSNVNVLIWFTYCWSFNFLQKLTIWVWC